MNVVVNLLITWTIEAVFAKPFVSYAVASLLAWIFGLFLIAGKLMPTVPLEDQITEVEKTIRDRGRKYPYMVEKGSLHFNTGEHKIAAMRAVQSTLMFIDENKDWIRLEFARRAKQKALTDAEAAELKELEQDPAVQAAFDAFPGATVTRIEPLDPAPEPESEPEETTA